MVKLLCNTLLAGCLCFATLPAFTAEWSLDLPGGDALPIHRYKANSDTVLIWTPSEFGLHAKRLEPLAKQLANNGLEVWLCDFHAAYFIQRGSSSLQRFSNKDLAHVIDTAVKQNKKNIILVSGSNGARFVLNGIHEWQTLTRKDHSQQNNTNSNLNAVKGAILFSPALYAGRPVLGKAARYIPQVYRTNIPLYLFQPEYSTTTLRVNDLRDSLQRGGARVFVHYLKQTRDGFHARPQSHLQPPDLQARKNLVRWLPWISKQLGEAQATSARRRNTQSVDAAKTSDVKGQTPRVTGQKKTAAGNAGKVQDAPAGLNKLQSDKDFRFSLPNLTGSQVQLRDYRGKPVIVSFWASWCPPCVREIPSMNALAQHPRYGKIPMIMVNIGETADEVKKFIKRHSVSATIAMDYDKTVYKRWNIYVVPSNFIFDAQGKLIYGSVGAIDWNTPEVRGILDTLLTTKVSRAYKSPRHTTRLLQKRVLK